MLSKFLAQRESTLFVIIIILLVAVGLRAPRFLEPGRLLSTLNDTVILIMLTMAQLAVIVSGGIDLSVASNLAFTGMATALLNFMFPGVPIVLLVVLALAIGAALGAFNGSLVAWGGVPPIIMTLATMSVFRGMVYLISGGAWVSAHQMTPAFRSIPRVGLLGMPLLMWFGFVTIAVMYVLMNNTRLGRELYAIGDNERSARLVGVNTRLTRFKSFVLSGAIAGLTGLLWVSRYASAQNQTAAGFELETVAAAVIGGVSIMGGSGSVIGAVLGAVFLGIVKNALNVIGVSPFFQLGIQGAVILIAIIANTVIDRRTQVRLGSRRVAA